MLRDSFIYVYRLRFPERVRSGYIYIYILEYHVFPAVSLYQLFAKVKSRSVWVLEQGGILTEIEVMIID